ncbi:MAG: PHP domain-containing protein [Elusimicrobiaceae bacterium]|nr:PHP domain-containing protein [Elusimicrobiaceae bacterium]
MPVVDLHTHSTFSDGTCTPEEVVHAALKRSVQIFSLTDHDTTNGVARAAALTQERKLRFVPGVEISTCDHDHLHFTGYNIDLTNPEFQTFLADNRTARQGRIKKVIAQLQAAGIEISEEDVFSRAANTVSRAHVADALRAKGYAPSRQAAFRKYLLEGQPGYVPAIGVSAVEAIKHIKKVGGLAVIAHPGLVSNQWDFPAWVEAGLDGIEVFYPAHSFAMRQELLYLADRYGLFATAGSDFHGPKGGRTLAPGLQLPKNHFDRLMNKLF